ncbi:MAG: hypothetical protein WDO13_00635 [Verrucomicrobiota bacterium]
MARAKAAWLKERQCLDPRSRSYGGFIVENDYADSRNSIFECNGLFAVYLYPDFPEYHQQAEILERLRACVAFMLRRQQSDGSISLGAGGIAGGNEVGFTLPGLCQTYQRLEKSDVPGREELLHALRVYILKGAACIRNYWPYTSNHRWTACAGPLAWANLLFPDPENVKVIEEYLQDGIDIDAQGLYYEERSPNYDNVANMGLLDLAEAYGRRDLLELVRRNLDFTLAMQQPSGECETLFSHRQDRGVADFRCQGYDVFKRMAVEFGRGDFATMADTILARQAQNAAQLRTHVPYRYLFDDPRLADEEIPRAPLPDKIELRCEAAPIWRWRDGTCAATVVADQGAHFWDSTYGGWGAPNRSGSFFDFHVGTAIIDAVKITWGAGTGAFRPEDIESRSDGSMRLFYRDPGSDHISHFRPREKWNPRKIPADQWAEVIITRSGKAFELKIEIGGWEDMPINVQLLLRETCRLTDSLGNTVQLSKGGHTFTNGARYELIGPDDSRVTLSGLPVSEHAMPLGDGRTITGEAERRCHRLIAGLFTPCAIGLVLSGPDVTA